MIPPSHPSLLHRIATSASILILWLPNHRSVADLANIFETPPRTDMIVLIGELGLWLIVLTAGLEVDTRMLTQIGLRAFLLALFGMTGTGASEVRCSGGAVDGEVPVF